MKLHPCLDDFVESLPVSQTEGESSEMYSAHYRILSISIDYLGRQKEINRQKRFAFRDFTLSNRF
jgi:hypothetical protein